MKPSKSRLPIGFAAVLAITVMWAWQPARAQSADGGADPALTQAAQPDLVNLLPPAMAFP